MIAGLTNTLRTRASFVLLTLEQGLDRILIGWMLIAGLACAARISFAPMPLSQVGPEGLLPYVLLVLAPVASIVLALRWFADGGDQPQPTTRLAVVGKWRTVSPHEARRHPLYGTSGIMVSLLIGMLLNVPVRAAEYLVTMPPIPSDAPNWLATLHMAMTFDAVLFSSLYGIAFVAALKRVPLFPRLLLAIWALDLVTQVGIARLAATTGLPGPVAEPLEGLLYGNVQKVLISAGLWLPYLLLSARVNVTFRSRVPD